jgi:signal transduction protein with GAF and PtsI domain
MLLRDTIVGALVVQSTGRRDYSVQDIELIGVICAQLVGIIENARIIEALDRGDQPKPRTAPRPSSTDQAGDEDQPIAPESTSRPPHSPYRRSNPTF